MYLAKSSHTVVTATWPLAQRDASWLGLSSRIRSSTGGNCVRRASCATSLRLARSATVPCWSRVTSSKVTAPTGVVHPRHERVLVGVGQAEPDGIVGCGSPALGLRSLVGVEHEFVDPLADRRPGQELGDGLFQPCEQPLVAGGEQQHVAACRGLVPRRSRISRADASAGDSSPLAMWGWSGPSTTSRAMASSATSALVDGATCTRRKSPSPRSARSRRTISSWISWRSPASSRAASSRAVRLTFCYAGDHRPGDQVFEL